MENFLEVESWKPPDVAPGNSSEQDTVCMSSVRTSVSVDWNL